MQASEAPHPFITAVFQWVATILGSSVVTLYAKEWLDKRREKQRAAQQSGVNEARVRSLDGETLRATGDKMLGLFDVIYKLNQDLAAERRRADLADFRTSQQEAFNKDLESQLGEAEETVRLSLLQMQQLHAAVSMKGVTLAEFPPDDLKKEILRLFPEVATEITRSPLWRQH
jgi:hypothetical protein